MLQAFFVLVAVAFALLTAPAGAAPVAMKTIGESPTEIESSWTRADFLNAQPAETPAPPEAAFDPPAFPGASISAERGAFDPGDSSQLPLRLHGKVFFRMGGVGYECSGTLIDSKNANSIFTAGHCIYDPATKQWATDFVFVPGYRDGAEPFGRYAAISIGTTPGWKARFDYSDDIGVATLAGTPVADLGGAEKVAFDLNPDRREYTIFGYPGDPDPPYSGERLVGCHATVVVRDGGSPARLGAQPCDMSHGASGGSWMIGGYLNAVTSYVRCDDDADFCGYLFAPYFSDSAKDLYTSPEVGGALPPTVAVAYSPPKLVRKRKVLFKFTGVGSTPLRYQCAYDRRAFTACGARTTISRLQEGKHSLRIRSIDQTGQKSRTLTRRFRVWPKRQPGI